MNWLDLILIIIFIVAAIGGAKNGFIKSIISLAALVLGVVLAVRLYMEFGQWLERFISNETAARVAGFAIILVAVVVAGAILGSVLSGVASTMGLGWLNRIGGTVFSVAAAAIAFGGILAGLSSLPGGALRGTVEGSFIASFLVNRFLPWLGSLSPFFRDPRGWLNGPTY